MVLVRNLVNEDVADRLKPLWALDEEGEVNSVSRDCGVPGLYFMMGKLILKNDRNWLSSSQVTSAKLASTPNLSRFVSLVDSSVV